MTKLEIEHGKELEPNECLCCGETSHSFLGYVYRNGAPYSIYYLGRAVGHTFITGAIGVGDFSDEGCFDERRAYFFEYSLASKQTKIIDPANSPWGDTKVLGRPLAKEEAAKKKKEFLALLKKILKEDQRFKDSE